MTEISVQLELTPAQQTRLEVAVDGARLSYGDAIGTAEIVFGNPDPAQITSAEHLRWVQLESVGFGEYLDLDWGSSVGDKVMLTNLAGFFAEPVAESALAGILALMRGVNQLVRLQDRREWIGDPLRARLRVLSGARITMLGRGAINRRLGELLAPFGCSITQLGTDLAPDQLDRELPATEVFVAAVPDTPETRGMMDERRIDLLPSSAFFVNLGRGSLVVEPCFGQGAKLRTPGGGLARCDRARTPRPGRPALDLPQHHSDPAHGRRHPGRG